MFKIVDKETWKRKDYFDYYFNKLRCTYSVTVNIDITGLMAFKRKYNARLYPLLIYVLSKAVNNHEEFRTAQNVRGEIGVWDELVPCYTVFHEETKTFSNLWTEWTEDLLSFMHNYERDIEQFGAIDQMDAKPDLPENIFFISSLPWFSFTGFNLNIYAEGTYLLPIFTWGKYVQEGERFQIPLSVQVHHAVCDGFHVARLVEEIQRYCDAISC